MCWRCPFQAYEAAPKLVSGEDPLDPIDESLPLAPLLEKGAIGMGQFPPQRDFFHEYLRTAPVGEVGRPNQTEVCGIFRLLLELKPGCEKQREVALEGLRFIARHNIKTRFAHEFQAIFKWTDTVLVETYKFSQSHLGLKKSDWLAVHADIVHLVVNKSSLTTLTKATESWSKVPEQLSDVVLGSEIGKVLFGFAMHQVTSFRIAEICQGKLKPVMTGKVSKAIFLKARQEALHEVEVLPGVAASACEP